MSITTKFIPHSLIGLVSVLPALLVMPAIAEDPNTAGTAFLFGDVSISNQATIDNTAFGGRRMEWTNGKYRNEFPNYQMVGRSFDLSDSVAYVGPVTLSLRELDENDHLTYNYQMDGADVDLAQLANVDFGMAQGDVFAAVAGVIGIDDAQYTAPGVIAFANRDNGKTAGSMNFSGVTADVDGATVNADAINVSNGSILSVVKQDTHSLSGAQRWYTRSEDIASDGRTALNANSITFDDSSIVIYSGATLEMNAEDIALDGDYALYSYGGDANISATNNLSLSSGTYYGALTMEGGNIDLSADNDLTIDAKYSSLWAYDGGISATAGNNITAISDDYTLISSDGNALKLNAGQDISVTSNVGNAVYLSNGGKVDMVAGGDITIGSAANGIDAWASTGTGGYVKNSGGKMNVSTNNLTINAAEFGIGANYGQSQIAIDAAGDVNITGGTRALHVGNATTALNVAKEDTSFITINADNINLTAGNIGVSAMSNGYVELNGNTKITAENAILTRGQAQTYINKTGDKTVQMDGNIAFDYHDGTSKSEVDAIVDVTLNGAESYWNGNTLVSYDVKPSEDKLQVNNTTIRLQNGAEWNASVITDSNEDTDGQYYTALNNLYVDGGNVNIADAVRGITVDSLVAKGLTINGGGETTGKMLVKKSADLMNGAVDNYTDKIVLANDAELLVDANDTGVDKFSIANDATVTLNGLKMLSDLTADERIFALADSGTIDVGGALVFTSNHKYDLTGSNDGHLTIAKNGLGGLSAAVGATDEDNYHGVLYSLTGNDETITTAAEIKNADVTVIGNNTNAVTLGAALSVGDNSSLVFNGATVDGAGSIENTAGGALGINDSNVAVDINNDGMMGIEGSTIASGKTIENRAGATLTILDSNIDADIMNFGKLISDPTTYAGTVTNAVDADADFDADTFDTTAVLNNSGVANMTNGVTFNSGAAITGNGLINLVSGTTHFNNTANSNTVKLANGAAFDGALIGGALNTQNGAIDAGLGTIQDANLYVDASLKGAGSIDTFAGTTGSTIKSINVTSTEYGSADSISMNVGGATLDENLQVTGAMNYYTKVEKDGDNLVFSDKLINKSTLDTTLADYATSDDLTTGLAGKATTTALTGVSDRVTTLENAGYQTASDVSTAIGGATIAQSQVSGLSDALAGKQATIDAEHKLSASLVSGLSDVATSGNFSDLTVADNAIAMSKVNGLSDALAGKANASTTLAGYGITDAYTKGEVDTAITAALTNGSDAYQTASQVSTAISGATIAQSQVTGLSDALAGKANASTTLAGYGITDAYTKGEVDTALAGKANASTTLAGYGITDAYTKGEVDTAITAALANAGGQGGAYQTASAVETKIADTAAAATYDNSTSGLAATTLQGAIDETASTVATINTNMGKVHGLVSSENGAKTLHETQNGTTSTNVVSGEYKGNLAVGTTVEDHLIALDNAIGTMSALDTTNGVLSNTASVATNLQNLDTAAASNAQNIQNIVDGTTTVAKATTATNATNAVNATNDGQGRNIASTYATLQLVNDTVGDMSTVSGTYVSNTASVATNLNQLSAAIDSITANSVAGANAYTDQRVEALDKDLSAGVAGAVALSSVAVSGVERGEVSVGAGYGYFNGQSAAAFGAAMGLSNRWSVNAGAGISNSDVSFRAGTNYKFKLF